MQVRLIAAIDQKRGLAKGGRMAWNLPKESQYFKDKIKGSEILMGWGTFVEALNLKPLEGCKNVVVTEQDVAYPYVEIVHDLDKYMKELDRDIWIIGGGQIFAQTLDRATELYLTQIDADFDCDVFFPEYEAKFHKVSESEPHQENDVTYRFQVWKPNQ